MVIIYGLISTPAIYFSIRLPEYRPSWEVNRKINNTQEFFEYIKKPIKERLNRRHAEIEYKLQHDSVC